MVISRAPVRIHFASLLATALVGTGLPAQAVFPYLVGDFGGKASVVSVGSGPVERRIGGFGNCWDVFVTLRVFVHVLYADPKTEWSESDSMDALDAIEAIIGDVVIANRNAPGYWTNAKYSAATEPDVIAIGNVAYQRELVKVQMEIIQ